MRFISANIHRSSIKNNTRTKGSFQLPVLETKSGTSANTEEE
jgi:hypothetical protein